MTQIEAYCEECEKLVKVKKISFGRREILVNHVTITYELECGHDRESDDFRFDS